MTDGCLDLLSTASSFVELPGPRFDTGNTTAAGTPGGRDSRPGWPGGLSVEGGPVRQALHRRGRPAPTRWARDTARFSTVGDPPWWDDPAASAGR
ncbi:hypothetical protein HBB16_20920 [Pseudonocardia sp. MCCB 268]|nr:hypothetical protein [Pseudonocardia cytotoxica]